MRFDREIFFPEYRKHFGSLTQQQVNGLTRLLDRIEADPHIPDNKTGLFFAAYMLSTVRRETAYTFMPIHEYGGTKYFIRRYGSQTRVGKRLGNDTPEEGAIYAGRGDTQTTGEDNYERAEEALRREYPEIVADFERRTGRLFDLTVGDQPNDLSDPDNMLDPAISYAVMSFGMRTGMFTGRKLSQFVKNGKPNYLGMRGIINGTDHDDLFAADAQAFEKILTASLTKSSTKSPAVVRPENEQTPVTNLPAVGGSESDGSDASSLESPPENVVTVTQTEPIQTNSILDSVQKKAEWFSGKLLAIPAAICSVIASAWSYITSAPSVLTISIIAAGALIVTVYLILYIWLKRSRESNTHAIRMEELRLQQQREKQAYDLTTLQVHSAASEKFNTVRIVPHPTATE